MFQMGFEPGSLLTKPSRLAYEGIVRNEVQSKATGGLCSVYDLKVSLVFNRTP